MHLRSCGYFVSTQIAHYARPRFEIAARKPQRLILRSLERISHTVPVSAIGREFARKLRAASPLSGARRNPCSPASAIATQLF